MVLVLQKQLPDLFQAYYLVEQQAEQQTYTWWPIQRVWVDLEPAVPAQIQPGFHKHADVVFQIKTSLNTSLNAALAQQAMPHNRIPQVAPVGSSRVAFPQTDCTIDILA